ncbi:phage capsid protein [Acinetobacter junii]|uniref:phage capsid protein n=1 Tax=Acinetobacter junii TaxID=40215 RepID=UPI003A874408
MSYNTIDSVFVKQYADTYVALLEQKESKLLSTVTNIGEVVGTSFTVNEYGSLGDTDTAITRFGATQYTDASFASRLATMSDFPNFTRLAIQDLPRLKANPQDKMLQGLHAKWNRKVDRVIYNALIGNASRKTVGADTYTNVALPASQILGDVAVAPTKQLLIDVRTKFMENECDEDIYITYNSDLLNAILADPTLTSADYLAGQMLQKGQVSDFLGMKWVHAEFIKATDGASATGVAYTRSAVEIGINTISPLKIVEVEDANRYHSIGEIKSLGAVRTDEKRVVAFKFAV